MGRGACLPVLTVVLAVLCSRNSEGSACNLTASSGPVRYLSSAANGVVGIVGPDDGAAQRWDFQGVQAAFGAAGPNFTLSCIAATNVSLGPPGGGGRFVQLASIVLGPEMRLVLASASLTTTCSALQLYQQYLCSTLRVAGSIQLGRGMINVASWNDGLTSITNSEIICPDGEAQPPPCFLVGVTDDVELVNAFQTYQSSVSAPITIVLADNITFPPLPQLQCSPNTTRTRAAEAFVLVQHNATVVPSPLLPDPVVVDWGLRTDIFRIVDDPSVVVTLQGFTVANLAAGYFPPTSPIIGQLSDRIFAFMRNRRQLIVTNMTCVVAEAELTYTKYWVTFLLSPVPEARAQAAWLQSYGAQISQINDSGIYVTYQASPSAWFYNVRITDQLPGRALLQPYSPLFVMASEGAPLSAVSSFNSEADFITGLATNNTVPDPKTGRQYLLTCANITIGSPAWPAGGVSLNGNTWVGNGLGQDDNRINFAQRPGALLVPAGATLVLNDLKLADLPPLSKHYSPSSAGQVLASAMWPITVAPAAGDTRAGALQVYNTTVIIDQQEIDLLIQALIMPDRAVSSADPALIRAVQAFFGAGGDLRMDSWGPNYVTIVRGTTARYAATNVTYRTPVLPCGEAAGPNLTALGVPYNLHSGSGLPKWAIGVIVGVGIPAVAALVALLVALRRRRHAAGAWFRSKRYWDSMLPVGVVERPAGAADPAAGSGHHQDLGSNLRPSSDLFPVTVQPGLHVLNPDAVMRAQAKPDAPLTPHTTVMAPATASNSIEVMSSSQGAITPSPAMAAAAVAAASAISAASGEGAVAATPTVAAAPAALTGRSLLAAGPLSLDSFDQPPSNSVAEMRPAMMATTSSGPPHSGAAAAAAAAAGGRGGGRRQQRHSILMATAGSLDSTRSGAALDAMHSAINTFGRDITDNQLAIHSLLGKGAYGTVYRGTWRGLQVAVKAMVFNPEGSASAVSQQRPLLEAAISSNLAHRNIVTTYAYELTELAHEFASMSTELAQQGGGWRLCLIQEYCDAGTLKAVIDAAFFAAPEPPSTTGAPAPVLSLSISAPSQAGTGSGPVAKPQGTPKADTAPRLSKPHRILQKLFWPSSIMRRGSAGSSLVTTPAPAPAIALPPGTFELAAQQQQQQPLHARQQQQQQQSQMLPLPPPLAQSGQSEPPPAVTSSSSRSGPQSAAVYMPSLASASDIAPPEAPGSLGEAVWRYVEAALQIANGMLHIHAKNIVHGDLNPSNVLLCRAPGTPLGYVLKVADFGLSVRVHEGQSHLSNLFQGTPYYVAPEVLLSGRVSLSADVFSFGIVMWELQCGERPPWRRGARLPTFPSLNTSQLVFRPDCPPDYAQLARRCFHGSKDLRPTMAAVREALTAMQERLEGRTRGGGGGASGAAAATGSGSMARFPASDSSRSDALRATGGAQAVGESSGTGSGLAALSGLATSSGSGLAFARTAA